MVVVVSKVGTILQEIASIDCGHAFCYECLTAYLLVMMKTELRDHSAVRCPMNECAAAIDDQLAMQLLISDSLKQRYQQLITASFVDRHRQMRWCPKPDCGHAIKVDNVAARRVQCKCGTSFCFACDREDHEPIPCQLLSQWTIMCYDSVIAAWLADNVTVRITSCPERTELSLRTGMSYVQEDRRESQWL